MFDSRKALRWSAFFIAWIWAAQVSADVCALAPGGGEPVVSRQVLDGDTLELVDGRRVRLIGINTPEIGRQGAPSEPYAQKARAELQRLAGSSGLRLVVGDAPRDKYGRILGHLFDAQGVNIEAQLLRRGMGFAIGIPPNLALLECHLREEAVAREAGLGVWRQSPITNASAVRDGGFKLIRGKVVRVERAGRHVWVELDGPLVVRLPAAELAVGDPLASWRGRHLEARGWVVDRGAQRGGKKRFMLPVAEPGLIIFQ